MTNDDLQLDVAAELSWDPKVDSRAIAVSADNGAVTLRGTVGSFREKREAGRAAARVYGVADISNELLDWKPSVPLRRLPERLRRRNNNAWSTRSDARMHLDAWRRILDKEEPDYAT